MKEMLKNKGILGFIFALLLVTYIYASQVDKLENGHQEDSLVMTNEQIN